MMRRDDHFDPDDEEPSDHFCDDEEHSDHFLWGKNSPSHVYINLNHSQSFSISYLRKKGPDTETMLVMDKSDSQAGSVI